MHSNFVGNYTVASELLKCGYRSLEAKNEDGQTAVHLASRLGKNDILEKLISSGIASNCLEKLMNYRDRDGYTALHVSFFSMNFSQLKSALEKSGLNLELSIEYFSMF